MSALLFEHNTSRGVLPSLRITGLPDGALRLSSTDGNGPWIPVQLTRDEATALAAAVRAHLGEATGTPNTLTAAVEALHRDVTRALDAAVEAVAAVTALADRLSPPTTRARS